MNDHLIHLRVKIKSLAAEAVIIRKEAQKTSGLTKYKLNLHRTTVVREHARINLLAYGFLRGKKYQEMELKCDIPPDFRKVIDIAKRFGAEDEVALVTWISEAKEYIKSYNKTVYFL